PLRGAGNFLELASSSRAALKFPTVAGSERLAESDPGSCRARPTMPQPGWDGSEEHPLIVGSEELIPDEELARMAAALEVALSTAGVGRVGPRATFTEPTFWSLRSVIHVTVSDLEAGVAVLRRTLRSVAAPLATS